MCKLKEVSMKANEVAMDCIADVQTADNGICRFLNKHNKKLSIVGYGLAGFALCLIFSLGMMDVAIAAVPPPGDQVFTRADTAMQGVFRQIRRISSIAAGLFLTVAILMKMCSRTLRTVDEANAWIKRIIIGWACLNAVGFILTFVQEIIGTDMDLPTIP